MGKTWLVVAVVVALGVAAYFYMQPKPMVQTETPVVKSGMEKTIVLAEQNKSSESGMAVLSEKDGKTVVTIIMSGAPTAVPQPAHLHTGSCPNVGAVVYPLTNVVNGKSETTLDVTMAELESKRPLGLNVHKSVSESKVYVSCGDL